MSAPEIRYEELLARAKGAVTDEESEACLADIELAIEFESTPRGRARLLMCRARVRSDRWQTEAVCADARAAMDLFELADEHDLAVDAASWAAAHASRLGDISLASELATKSLLALEAVVDERIRVEILNRLGIFCYSFLDFERAIEQFEASLAAARRVGDQQKIFRQVHNIADCVLVVARQRRLGRANVHVDPGEVARAESMARWLLANATDEFNQRSGSHRLLAEALSERGRIEEAIQVLERFQDRSEGIGFANQRAALAWIEARCQRQGDQPQRALAAAERAVALARKSADDHELMLALEELAACHEAVGDPARALAAAREVNARMWTIHQRQTQQVVSEVWARADLMRDQRNLRFQAAEASRWAEEDALTSIGNRRRLERFLREEATEHANLSFVVMDVDRFKEINDSYGHDVGDAVLAKVGQVLGQQIRPGQVAVRYGGDEFVLGLAGVDLSIAAVVAERVRRRIEGLEWGALAPGLDVTTSHGVAAGQVNRWEVVFAAADAALYEAKRQGRNTVATAPLAAA